MDFPFPFLESLTLPTDAGPGDARIEINPNNDGSISVYDNNGTLMIQIGGTTAPEFVRFFTGNASEVNEAGIAADHSGAAASEVPFLTLLSPTFNPDVDWMELRLMGSGEAGEATDPATFRIGNGQGTQAHRLAIDAGTDKFLNTDVVLVAGTVTVNNIVVTASSRLMITRRVAGGTVGTLTYTVAAGSYTINSSSATDTSTVDVLIIEPF